MNSISSKPLIVGCVCVLSLVILIVVVARAIRPEEPAGLRAGTWTATGTVEPVPDSQSTQSGVTWLGELASFEIEPSTQESPFVKMTLTYRDGSHATITASSEMQPGYLQATLTSPTGAGVPITFRKKDNSASVEVSDGHMLARFAQ